DLLDLGARIVGIAEHLEDARGHVAAAIRRIARDLDDDGLALGGRGAAVERHLTEVRGDARIVGLEQVLAADLADDAGEARAPAGEDLIDLALGALHADPRRHAHLIAVERAAAV